MPKKQKEPKSKTEYCLFDGCNKAPEVRGLCSAHYLAANRAVQRGFTTWDTLEKAGKILPRKRGHVREWFTIQ